MASLPLCYELLSRLLIQGFFPKSLSSTVLRPPFMQFFKSANLEQHGTHSLSSKADDSAQDPSSPTPSLTTLEVSLFVKLSSWSGPALALLYLAKYAILIHYLPSASSRPLTVRLNGSKRSLEKYAFLVSTPKHYQHREATDDGWLYRAGLAIAFETRESKGQSWLSRRERSTSLVRQGEASDSDDDTTNARSGLHTRTHRAVFADDEFSPVTPRFGSRQHSRRGSSSSTGPARALLRQPKWEAPAYGKMTLPRPPSPSSNRLFVISTPYPGSHRC
ncbi:hypothetical protein IWZ03DRAFT_436740 [Phyllosticta citriasiana]|uniref:Uncharacterized protein n=1 Tax=Phyllosticta citriasiana TaxID=595635 RepID=A0ABR1KA67_9PEZI